MIITPDVLFLNIQILYKYIQEKCKPYHFIYTYKILFLNKLQGD